MFAARSGRSIQRLHLLKPVTRGCTAHRSTTPAAYDFRESLLRMRLHPSPDDHAIGIQADSPGSGAALESDKVLVPTLGIYASELDLAQWPPRASSPPATRQAGVWRPAASCGLFRHSRGYRIQCQGSIGEAPLRCLAACSKRAQEDGAVQSLTNGLKATGERGASVAAPFC